MDVQMVSSAPLEIDGSQRLCYQAQDCAMTLRQGLDEYYTANSGLFDSSQASNKKIGAYLKNHDVTHIVFGTTTAMAEEILQDLWTFLAVDIPKRKYVFEFLGTDEAKAIMQSVKPWETLKLTVMALPDWVRIWRRSRQMTKQWPWANWECYLDQPLAEIRREFNIQVLTP